jgi:23S rRNA (pseudouridine1915-N3)-methyltransferase
MIVAIPDITIICVGTIKDQHIASLTAMYLGRLQHDARIRLQEIRDGTPDKEGEQLRGMLEKSGGYTFALSEEGKTYTSRQFAARLGAITGKITFIIGGATGLSEKIKKTTDELFSLSPLTFTHELARLLLFEQLYRACSILHNRGYHKG